MKRHGGFSIIELLVTLAIIGTVIIVSSGLLTTDTAQRERLLAHTDDQRNTLLAAEILREQLTPVGSGLSQDEARLSFACNGAAVEVYAQYIDTTIARPEERLFVFSIVSDSSGNRLTRGNYTPGTYRKGPRQPLVQDITDLTLIAVTDHHGHRHRATDISAAQQLTVALLEFALVGDGGAKQVSTILTPLNPTAWFQPTWGSTCAR